MCRVGRAAATVVFHSQAEPKPKAAEPKPEPKPKAAEPKPKAAERKAAKPKPVTKPKRKAAVPKPKAVPEPQKPKAVPEPKRKAAVPETDPFFTTVPDALKCKDKNGKVIPDTAVIPDFVHPWLARNVFDACLAMPECNPSESLKRDFNNPRWVTGESEELNYRGHTIPRDKMWFQRSVDKFFKYGYTGWQWGVSAGTYILSSIPALEATADFIDAKTRPKKKLNHIIVTKYMTGEDNIGMHSDKMPDWEPGSIVIIIKLGAARPFVITHDGVEIFNEVVQPGTAIIMGMNANDMLKHGVPAVDECGPSGSIVLRSIKTSFAWDEVDAKIEEAREDKVERQAKRQKTE